jgi:serine/threonine-protein kinase RsbW
MGHPSCPNIQIEVASRIESLDAVHATLLDAAGRLAFDEDAQHYISVAVRESVINAIKHGHRMDPSKRVGVTFVIHADGLEVFVRDEGSGFDPSSVPDPLAAENLLKGEGRGIFFMRSFMDEVSYAFPMQGGTVVRMFKRVLAATSRATAVRS